uniref:Uncharacterized protein n=1 Tax=Oryza glumipatula TaxID=40148 RepID=A0A0E0BQ31_9ORYZ
MIEKNFIPTIYMYLLHDTEEMKNCYFKLTKEFKRSWWWLRRCAWAPLRSQCAIDDRKLVSAVAAAAGDFEQASWLCVDELIILYASYLEQS